MSFEGLIGHRRAVEQLGRSLERGRLHHALLFQGPHGVGKRTLARALATELLCRDADDPAVARKLVENHAHPDLLVVRRVSRKIDKPPVPMGDLSEEQELEALSNKELSTQIRVVQIRALIEHAGFTPRQASCRVFLVDPADRMNLAAQNALLKTLEEPPGRTFLMLLRPGRTCCCPPCARAATRCGSGRCPRWSWRASSRHAGCRAARRWPGPACPADGRAAR